MGQRGFWDEEQRIQELQDKKPVLVLLSPSAKKVDAFLFKSLGGLMEQLNDCLQLGCL